MRYLVSGKEMKLLDQNTSQVFHVPELVLMEQASMAFVQKLLLLKQNKLSTALIACGSGNNGGDGLAIARLLREQGIFVFVWLAGEEEGHRTSSSYDVQKQICSAYSIPVVQKEKVSAGEASYDVVIDALFGTGLSREISGELANDIDVLNQLSGWKVAVDIASGICSDDGAVLGTAFRADDTITFSFGKKGQYLWPGNEYCGKVHVVSMGITQESWLDHKPHTAVLEPEDLKKLPSRMAHTNKGSYGKLLIIAGSVNMSGAACFCAKDVEFSRDLKVSFEFADPAKATADASAKSDAAADSADKGSGSCSCHRAGKRGRNFAGRTAAVGGCRSIWPWNRNRTACTPHDIHRSGTMPRSTGFGRRCVKYHCGSARTFRTGKDGHYSDTASRRNVPADQKTGF